MLKAPHSTLKLLVSSVLAVALTVLLAQSVSQASAPGAARTPDLVQLTPHAPGSC
jgi:hypothetical protein